MLVLNLYLPPKQIERENAMAAPHTSLTPTLPLSTLSGLNAERLYLALQTTAFSSILTTGDFSPSVGPDGKNAMFTLIDCLCYAIAAEVVAEIKNNSMLQAMPGMTDQGPAGAGIIVGFVK
jgi:hypothetical protein